MYVSISSKYKCRTKLIYKKMHRHTKSYNFNENKNFNINKTSYVTPIKDD